MKVTKKIDPTREAVRKARSSGKKIGFVPTMGALHKGHISLIEAAGQACDYVVVSIFVNPTQFGPGEDLQRYPRNLQRDLQICREQGVDLVFAPPASQMYPQQNLTWVKVEKLSRTLCGRFRPGHFTAVATVCAKLFNIVQPDSAFFGQKDAQQAAVIKKMVADLNMPLKIEVCPTVRDSDGLATSSRNKYLSAADRKQATVIFKALQECRQLIKAGETRPDEIKARMLGILNQSPDLNVQYVQLVDAEDLTELKKISGTVLAAVAVNIADTRLIDNIVVDAPAK